MLSAADPKYRAVVKQADAFRGACVRDLGIATGGISAQVGSIVTEAALVTAASRYFWAEGFSMPPSEEGYAHFMRAAKLGEKARQHQLAAWELAVREAQARTANAKRDGTGGKLAELAGESRPDSPRGPPGGSTAGAQRSHPKPAKRTRAKKPKIVPTTGEEPEKP